MYYLSAECLARASDTCPKDLPNRAYIKKLDLVSVEGKLVNLSAVAAKSKGEAYRLAGRIGGDWENFSLAQKKEYIRQLDDMARAMGYSALWTYWRINENRAVVDSFTLGQIAELRGYQKGWIYHKENEIKERLNTEKEFA
jgi:hypothetical protein